MNSKWELQINIQANKLRANGKQVKNLNRDRLGLNEKSVWRSVGKYIYIRL